MYTVIRLLLGLLGLSVSRLWALPPDTLWTRIYDNGGIEKPVALTTTPDGDVVLAVNEGWGAAGLWKLTIDGTLLWHRQYTMDFETFDFAAVHVTPSGGFIALGEAYVNLVTQPFALCTDSAGDILWSRVYDTAGGSHVIFRETAVMPNGFLFVGITFSDSNLTDWYVVRADLQGAPLWTRRYGGSLADEINGVGQTTDGGFLLAGTNMSLATWPSSLSGMWLIRLTSSGDTLWTRFYPDEFIIGGSDSRSGLLQMLPDNGAMLMGECDDPFLGGVVNVVRINALGDTLWTQKCRDGDFPIEPRALALTPAGGALVAGLTHDPFPYNTGSNMKLIRIAPDGALLWTTSFGRQGDDAATGVAVLPDNSFLVAGWSNTDSTRNDVMLVRTQPDSVAAGDSYHLPLPDYWTLTAYPNPFNAMSQIRLTLSHPSLVQLRIYDVLGQEVTILTHTLITSGTHEYRFDAQGLSSGIYFAVADFPGRHLTQKLLLIR